MEKYLPSIISLVGVILTIGVSLWLGLAKQKNDNKTAGNSVEVNLRDDLLQMQSDNTKQLNEKNERLERRDKQLADTQGVIFTQLEKITELNITVRNLQYEVQELRAELEKFNRKVFYIRDTGEKKDES